MSTTLKTIETTDNLSTYYDSIDRPWTLIKKPANPNNLPQLLNAGASILLEQGDRNWGTIQFGGVISNGSVSSSQGGSIWSGKRPTASNTTSNYYAMGFEMGFNATGGASPGIAITGYGGVLLMSFGPSGTIRDSSGVDMLTSSSLGVNVINSSLRTVGNLNSLNVIGNLSVKPSANLLIANTSLERIGIGTDTPQDKLDVNGNCNLSSGHAYKINGADVLSGSALGSGITSSSLTSVGTLSSLDVSGNVTANVISATTYVGLPAANTAPMTLDAVNGYVGINQVAPTEALDVFGNTVVDGTFRVIHNGPIATLSFITDPISLVTQTAHLTADDLTVGGDITQTSGTANLQAVNASSLACTGAVSGATLSGALVTATQPNITSVGTLGTLTVGGNIVQTSGTANLQVLNVPAINCSGTISGSLTTAVQGNITSVGSLTALTVDTNTIKVDAVNHRVGIKTTNPAYDLEVTGTCNISSNLTVGGDLTVNGSIVNPGVGETTIYTNASILYTPAYTASATVFSNFQTITIPANSVCLVDIICTATKNTTSTTAQLISMRLQSSTGSVTSNGRRDVWLQNDQLSGTLIINGTSANGTTGSGTLVSGEVQTNTTASDVSLYIGWVMTGNTSTAANAYKINVDDFTCTVTKVGTI